ERGGMAARFWNHVRQNVVGYVALFVALGGTAWAAGPLAGRNTVNSAAIINGQVKQSDVGANAVTSRNVVNGTLTRGDFARGTLLQGPRGPAGAKGPQGERGPQGPAASG